MNVEELRREIQSAADPISILDDDVFFEKYDGLKINGLYGIIDEFFNIEQKKQFLELERFKPYKSLQAKVVSSIPDDKFKIVFLLNRSKDIQFETYDLKSIIDTITSKGKVELLQNPDFFKDNNIMLYMDGFFESLEDSDKVSILTNKQLIEKYGFYSIEIAKYIASIGEDEEKRKLISLYELNKFVLVNILRTFSNENKSKIVLEGEYDLKQKDIINLLASMDATYLIDFIKDNKKFLEDKEIKPYQIIRDMSKENQLEIIPMIFEADLTEEEQKLILVTLRTEAKEELDFMNIPENLRYALKIQINDDIMNLKDIRLNDTIIIDWESDLEQYRGLDEVIAINAINLTEQERLKMAKLCEICPGLEVLDNAIISSSSAEEFVRGEAWIETVLNEIDENWTDIQKLAYIDNAIGKRISYTPDFDTEVSREGDARALWKIIESGYGVCNGVAQVEKYMLSKVGIEAEMVSGEKHAFLRIKGIELPMLDGGTKKGDTIVDPTWNLSAHRFGGRPNNFCLTYKEIREHDITSDGTDRKCHFNEELENSELIGLDDSKLREVFKSIGLAREDGIFPIVDFINESENIHKTSQDFDENIRGQLKLLNKYCPEYRKCQNSTMYALSATLLNSENLQFEKAVVNRVYNAEDESKTPIVYIYFDFGEKGQVFYPLDERNEDFFGMTRQVFEEMYRCYDMDLEKSNNIKPWESDKTVEKDLSRSSGSDLKEDIDNGGER